jgi:hypothetical protein
MNYKIFNDQTVTTATPVTSSAVKVVHNEGPMSLQWTFTSAGAGTATFELLTSNDGATYISAALPIATDAAKDTAYTAEFDLPACKYIEIKCTAGTETITGLTARLFGREDYA